MRRSRSASRATRSRLRRNLGVVGRQQLRSGEGALTRQAWSHGDSNAPAWGCCTSCTPPDTRTSTLEVGPLLAEPSRLCTRQERVAASQGRLSVHYVLPDHGRDVPGHTWGRFAADWAAAKGEWRRGVGPTKRAGMIVRAAGVCGDNLVSAARTAAALAGEPTVQERLPRDGRWYVLAAATAYRPERECRRARRLGRDGAVAGPRRSPPRRAGREHSPVAA